MGTVGEGLLAGTAGGETTTISNLITEIAT